MYKVKALRILNFMAYACAKLGCLENEDFHLFIVFQGPKYQVGGFFIRGREYRNAWVSGRPNKSTFQPPGSYKGWWTPYQGGERHLPKVWKNWSIDCWGVGHDIRLVTLSMANAMHVALSIISHFLCFASESLHFFANDSYMVKYLKYRQNTHITLQMEIKR